MIFNDWKPEEIIKYIKSLNSLIKFHEVEIESIRDKIKALEKRLSNT